MAAWVARLAPGLAGVATHGLIRTAHAARALAEVETKPRLDEMADGLAYWAATYHAFPSQPPSELRHYELTAALQRVPGFDVPIRGNIDQTLAGLDDLPQFSGVVNLLRPGADPLIDLSALTERFAAVYMQNAQDPSRTFAVVHALTGPSALRLLAPHVTRSALELLLVYAWQVAAAIYGVWGKDRTMPEFAPQSRPAGGLIAASVENGAAHAIKFVEACLREYEVNPKPIYLAAAADAAGRLRG